MSYSIETTEQIQINRFLDHLDITIPSIETNGKNLSQLCLQYYLLQLRTCTKCGLCSNVCFMKAIDVVEENPVISKPCVSCKRNLLNKLRSFPTELSSLPTTGKSICKNYEEQKG